MSSHHVTGAKILRLPEVIDRTGLCRSSIYQKVIDGQFPKTIKIGGTRSVGWIEAEVSAWIENHSPHRGSSL